MKHFWVVATVLALAACATNMPPVSPEELNAARARGELALVFDRLGADLNQDGLSAKSRTALEAQRQQIGGELAEARVRDVRGTLAAYDGLVPLDVLAQAVSRIAPMRAWDSARFAVISNELADSQVRTRTAIDERLQWANALTVDEAARKLALYDELAVLHGGQAAEPFVLQKQDYIDHLYSLAVQAVEQSRFAEAAALLDPVAAADPDYRNIRGIQLQINASLFEKRFWDALGQGSPEEAYRLFMELAESPGFELVRSQVSAAAEDLAKYFVVLGDKQRRQDMAQAFQAFRHARYIRNQLGQANYSKEETAFIEQLNAHFDKAHKANEPALAFGYLLALEMLNPGHAAVRRNMRDLRERMLAEAKIKLAAMPMSNASQDRAYGSGVASKVSQFLLAEIPRDIEIIERAQFESIVAKARQPDSSTYLSHYYMQGEILEAGVDTNEKRVNRQVRVVTEYLEAPNPEHEKWLKLSGSARRDNPEPPKTIQVPKREDITIRSTAVKKVGVFSVTFRLVDPFSSKVLFVDSLAEKVTHEGENIEGMDIGEFHQKAQSASLPADGEILDGLAERVSRLVAERLMVELRDPELRYRDYGLRAINEDKLQSAAVNLGYATVLYEHKAQDATAVREAFLDSLMRSSR